MCLCTCLTSILYAMSRQRLALPDVDAYEHALIRSTDSYPTNSKEWSPLSTNNVQRMHERVLWARVPTDSRYINKRFFEVDVEDVTIAFECTNTDPAYLYKIFLSVSPYIMLVRKLQPVSVVVSLDYAVLYGIGTSSWSLVKVTAFALSGSIINTMDFVGTSSGLVKFSMILDRMIQCVFQFVSIRSLYNTIAYPNTSKDRAHGQTTHGEEQQDATIRHNIFFQHAS